MTETEVQGRKYIKFVEVSFLENRAFCVTLVFVVCENCDI